MKQTVDLFGDLIASMVMTGTITDIVDNTDGTFTLSVNKTYWVRPGILGQPVSTITIGGTDYEVTAVVYCQSITVKSLTEPVGDTYTLSAPYYYHGTPKAISNERDKTQFSWDKCPVVWFVEPYREEEIKSPRSIIARRAEVILFLLDEANYSDWRTNEHYSNVITPMDAMKEVFMAKIRSKRAVFDYDNLTFSEVRHAKFGAEGPGGHTQSIFNERLSGIELRFNVGIYKDYRCPNC